MGIFFLLTTEINAMIFNYNDESYGNIFPSNHLGWNVLIITVITGKLPS